MGVFSGEAVNQGKDSELAVRVASMLIIFGGSLTVGVAVIWRSWEGAERSDWDPDRLLVFALVAVAGGAVLWFLAASISWRVILIITPIATIFIGVSQVLAAGVPSFGPVVLLWPVLWAFAFFPPRIAIAHAGLAMAVMTAIFLWQDNWDPPFAYIFFLGGTIVATAWTVRHLVQRAETLAEREAAARRELSELNETLEERVRQQVDKMGRLERLQRFLSPSVAEAVLSADDDASLAPHRTEIAVVFCDLRGFTAFSTSAEPEDVTALLGRFHQVIGQLVDRYQATVGGFAGDGVLLYLNDPVKCDDPPGDAVRLALDLIPPMEVLFSEWRHRGFDLGCGVGIAYGFATLGVTGFDNRREYAAVGKVVNLAARLSDEAGPSEILLDQRAWSEVRSWVAAEPIGGLDLKGFSAPVPAFRLDPGSGPVASSRTPARRIPAGPGSS